MYQAVVDPYCYAGTNVLINKAGLKDHASLEMFELEASTTRIESGVPLGKFDAAFFSRVHHHIFQDVYPWAGEYRTIRISKGNSMFCFPENINSELAKCFDWLKKSAYLRNTPRSQFAEDASHFLAELNAIHAFREGNGRTQLSFLVMLARQAQHPIDLRTIDPKLFMRAMIASFNGDENLLQKQIISLMTDRETH
jgi:cell filamentation protein